MIYEALNAVGFVNTTQFQPAANHFRKYGRYDDGDPDTYYNDQYWTEEERRCFDGYEVGGIWIPGDYYFYLNYCRIQLVNEKGGKSNTYKQVHDNKGKQARRVGQRSDDFPAFWDVDYMYYRAVDIATNGITDEEYEKLPIDLHIPPEWRHGGHHFVWLKPRGVGASWKGASKPLRNFSFIEDSKSYMIANEKEFLTKDGIWSKFHELNNWLLQTNTKTRRPNALGIGKKSEYKNSEVEMHIRASFKYKDDYGNETEEGLMSEVYGVSLQNNWQKARGKRGQLLLWEELGKFPNADKAWEVARPSVEEGDINFGTMIGFGTGGTEGSNFESIRNMFYNPADYNIICMENIFDIGLEGTLCGFFTPATMNTAFIDKDGNSMQELARDYYQAERDKAKLSKDPTLLPRKMAEAPFTPKEAVLEVGNNLFLSKTLTDHRDRVQQLNLHMTMGTYGNFERVGTEIKFFNNPDAIPIHLFPHLNKYKDYIGSPVIYQQPYKVNGEIPKNLYKLCLDTYRNDDVGTSSSIGSIHIIEQPNNFTPTRGDIVVAAYHGRPPSQEEFNRILFLMAEYYNAEIAFEADEPGDVVGYAKRNKKIHLLADAFELAYDETLKSSGNTSKQQFSMKMSSGKDNKRKKQGDLFIKSWLYQVRKVLPDGREVLNLHTIMDLGFLEELCAYDIDKNCDRISAFRIGMYHQQELAYNEIVPKNRPKAPVHRELFKNGLF